MSRRGRQADRVYSEAIEADDKGRTMCVHDHTVNEFLHRIDHCCG